MILLLAERTGIQKGQRTIKVFCPSFMILKHIEKMPIYIVKGGGDPMINMVGVQYELPPPPAPPDIPAVVAAMPQKNLYGNRGRDREGSGKKRRSIYDEILMKKEEEEGFRQMGCFFEAKA